MDNPFFSIMIFLVVLFGAILFLETREIEVYKCEKALTFDVYKKLDYEFLLEKGMVQESRCTLMTMQSGDYYRVKQLVSPRRR